MEYTAFKHKLEDFLAQKLGPREADLLRAHLAKCKPCRLIFDDVRSSFTPTVTPQKQKVSPVSVEIEGYQIVTRLGKGGMGEVFKAVQLSMERDVALKILAKELASNEAFIQRFEREARAAGQLSHPNLIRVYDFGKSGETYFFSMEFIDGKNVAEMLRDVDRLDTRESLEICLKVADALGYAQESGLIHRDIKPDNIMISIEGEVKVADLGLAKQLGKEGEKGSITMAGERLGTPYYMPPEQIRETKDVDHRADIYSLGATMFHMITGRRPFTGKTSVEIMQNVISDEVYFTDQEEKFIGSAVCDFILDMLEKNPRRRPQKWKMVVKKINSLLKSAR